MSQVITQTDALVELALLTQQTSEEERDAFYVKVLGSDLPMEVVTRLGALWDVTKEVGGHIIHAGKLIIAEIMKFIQKHPHLTIGMAIGLALHAILAVIPFVGPLLSALVATISASIGYRLDTGKPTSDTLQGTAVNTLIDLISLAKTFFEYFFNVIKLAIPQSNV
jgi:hypothetical protein